MKTGVQKTLGRDIFWMVDKSKKSLWHSSDSSGNPMRHYFSICCIKQNKNPTNVGISIILDKYILRLTYL